MRVGIFAIVAVLAACDAPQPLAPVKVAIHVPVQRFTLPNGLEVVVQEDHRAPRVAINLRYHAGAKNDPPGRAGMAHLIEHLQFAESQRTTRDSFFKTMNELGAEDINGTTEADGTNYFETVPTSSLESVLWVEADRMASARAGWSGASIDREKNIVAQELRLRYRNEPNGFRYQLLTHAIYPEGHPYRRALDEEEQERSSTPEDLKHFAETYYGPDDATLLLVGDVTVDAARDVVARTFASVAPCASHAPARRIDAVKKAALKKLRVVADVQEPLVYVAWPLPAPAQDAHYELAYALDELGSVASGFASDTKKTMHPRSVRSYIIDDRLGSIGVISGVPVEGATADDLLDAVIVARRRILRWDWTSRAGFRSEYIAEQVREMESLGDRARRMQIYLDLYGEPDHVMADLSAVQAVLPNRIIAATDKFLDPDDAAVVVVTPDANAPRAGKIIEEVRR